VCCKLDHTDPIVAEKPHQYTRGRWFALTGEKKDMKSDYGIRHIKPAIDDKNLDATQKNPPHDEGANLDTQKLRSLPRRCLFCIEEKVVPRWATRSSLITLALTQAKTLRVKAYVIKDHLVIQRSFIRLLSDNHHPQQSITPQESSH
jgi:hypothetical protein